MLDKIMKWFLHSKPVLAYLRIAKRFKPWGFEGLSLHYVMSFFWEGILKGALTTRAVAISYRLLLAIFPMIIILIYLLSLIQIQDFQENLMTHIQNVFPGNTYSYLEDAMVTLQELTANKDQGSFISIVGLFLMLYYASSSINAILIGFDESYHLEEESTWVFRRLLSIILMFALGAMMVAAVLLIMFSGSFIEYLQTQNYMSDDLLSILANVVKWLTVSLLVYTSITILYNVGTRDKKNIKFMSAGASFATLFFIIGSIGFAYFINNLAQYSKLYGSLGSFLVLLIWINFNFVILLLGFELNSSILRAKSILFSKNEELIS